MKTLQPLNALMSNLKQAVSFKCLITQTPHFSRLVCVHHTVLKLTTNGLEKKKQGKPACAIMYKGENMEKSHATTGIRHSVLYTGLVRQYICVWGVCVCVCVSQCIHGSSVNVKTTRVNNPLLLQYRHNQKATTKGFVPVCISERKRVYKTSYNLNLLLMDRHGILKTIHI